VEDAYPLPRVSCTSTVRRASTAAARHQREDVDTGSPANAGEQLIGAEGLQAGSTESGCLNRAETGRNAHAEIMSRVHLGNINPGILQYKRRNQFAADEGNYATIYLIWRDIIVCDPGLYGGVAECNAG
jgi:hypothetical protein